MKDAPLILLAAGGTGGHLFPAEALAHALRACGARTALATDGRAAGFGEGFPAEARFAFKAATPSGRSPLGMAKAGATLLAGALAARAALAKLKPDAVIGFGGYPCVPPVLAATWSKIPSALHEQNAVMGRANRFLAARVDAIATGFPELGGVGADVRAKATHVGNPVRPAVIEAAKVAYVAPGEGPIRIVVTGGSQGARVMSDVPPAAIAALPAALRARLAVTQQARPEDVARAQATYAAAGVAAEVASFFKDLPARIAASHLVIGRSGASTVSELAAIGRASILVPLPGALDQDQAANAAILAKAGGAEVVPQSRFDAAWLRDALARRIEDPDSLARAAAAARAIGAPDAASRLAGFVLALVERKTRP